MNLKESDTLCSVYLRQAKTSAHNLSHSDTLLNCAYTCFRIANNATTHILSPFTLGRTYNFAANQQATLISH